jgi:hypothetical protein
MQVWNKMSFSDREIERQRRAATSRKKNVDEERAQLMRDIAQIIQTGTLEQMEEKLELLGMGRDTPKGRELLPRFIPLRGASLR